jgi:hypothetical protein
MELPETEVQTPNETPEHDAYACEKKTEILVNKRVTLN